jgi:hypothetical protein
MVSAQAAALPRAGSNLDAVRRVSQHLPDHAVHRAGQFAVDQLERPVVAARHQNQLGGEIRLVVRRRLRLQLSYIRPAHAPHSRPNGLRIAPASLCSEFQE